jgi:hypothetical protein
VIARVVAVMLALALVACATDDGRTGETGVLTPAPSPTIDDPAGTPPDGGDVDPRRCDGEIGAVVVEEVEVPDGASCTLNGTTVEGNVTVGRESTLEARSVAVDGDLQGRGALAVNVVDSTVDGNIQVDDGGSSTVAGTTIDGDLQWDDQEGALEATGNTIDGNLQAEGNRGGLTVEDNTINGNLECEDNDPAPSGGGNQVDGDMEGQCAGF